jgi:eukaryotic-like serine/threonine-protein kinase
VPLSDPWVLALLSTGVNAGEPKVGDILDSRYRITGLLGTGGMGSVYRAEHVTIRRPVAIKVLHPNIAEDPDYARRFEREAFVTGRTDHPNCVTVSDFGPLAGGGFYLVMELVDGALLADVLDDVERMPPRRALHIIRHVLRGLGHAHQNGIVHRDVKPANVILVTQDSDDDFAKILDFGIAKLVDAAAAHAPGNNQLTRVGTTVGTPTYVAPEQAVGGVVDQRSDLYSCSIMLYEMIAGRPPFQDEDTVRVLAKHLSAPVPAMAELVPDVVVSPAVEEVIRKGLSKDKAERHASAAAYIAAIDDLFARRLVDGLGPSDSGGRPMAFSEMGLAMATPVPGPAIPLPVPPISMSGPIDALSGPQAVSGPHAAPEPRVETRTSIVGLPAPRRRRLAVIGAVVAAVVVIAIVTSGGDGPAKGKTSGKTAIAASGGVKKGSDKGSDKASGEKKPQARPADDDTRRKVLYQADDLIQKKRPEQAIALIKKQLGDVDADPAAQVMLGHAYMADGRPLEGLKAYWRVVETEKKLALGSDKLRHNVESLLGGRDSNAAIAALDLLAGMDDEGAQARIAAVASSDTRNAVRLRARKLADEKGYGEKIDRVKSFSLDLLQFKSCQDRATAVPVLRQLGDKRAIAALERARGKRRRGFLIFGGGSANKCMIAALDEAIAHLSKLP